MCRPRDRHPRRLGQSAGDALGVACERTGARPRPAGGGACACVLPAHSTANRMSLATSQQKQRSGRKPKRGVVCLPVCAIGFKLVTVAGKAYYAFYPLPTATTQSCRFRGVKERESPLDRRRRRRKKKRGQNGTQPMSRRSSTFSRGFLKPLLAPKQVVISLWLTVFVS